MWSLLALLTTVNAAFNLPFEPAYVSVDGGALQRVEYVRASDLYSDKGKSTSNAIESAKNAMPFSIDFETTTKSYAQMSLDELVEELRKKREARHRHDRQAARQRRRRHRRRGHRRHGRHRRHRRHRHHKRHLDKVLRDAQSKEHVVENGPLSQSLFEHDKQNLLTHQFDMRKAREIDDTIDDMDIERTERINLPDYTQITKIIHKKDISPSTLAVLHGIRGHGSLLAPAHLWSNGESVAYPSLASRLFYGPPESLPIARPTYEKS